MNDLMSGGLHRLWKDRLVESLAPFPGMRHLDVAGGTGDVAFRVYKAIRDAERIRNTSAAASDENFQNTSTSPGGLAAGVGSVVVCDINAAMLKEGERKAAAQGIDSASMEFIEGNAERLPFPDSHFDSYTIAFGIRNVTDRMAALREARRVLRPGGRFLCLEFSKVVLPGLQQLYDLYSFNVIPAMGQLVANDSESYRYLVESIRMFPGQMEWAAMIQDAGFGIVEYENLTGGVVAIHSGVNPSSA
jgi:2-methoxy-6-polyprenyl-1,4-benzoquinol methylase